jgi:hypothetical protein
MKYILLTIVFSLEIYASSTHTYKIEGKSYQFNERNGVLINSSCEANCIANKRMKSLKIVKPSETKNQYSMSFGSYLCENLLKGSSLFGVDIQRNMKAFCFFREDESLIEINSLTKFGLRILKK